MTARSRLLPALAAPLCAALLLTGCSGGAPGTDTAPGAGASASQERSTGATRDGSATTGADQGGADRTVDPAVRERAEASYTAYAREQVDALLAGTEDFAAAYTAGDGDRARHLYPRVRSHFERIEPTAESFGDLDPALDLREADFQDDPAAGGGEWTGWHVAEKDLWNPDDEPSLDAARRGEIATRLVADTEKLHGLIHAPDFTVPLEDVTDGAIALLEEVAATKVTGEEEVFSHTDLYDIQANLEGSTVAFDTVRELARANDPEVVEQVDARTADLQKVLDEYRASGDGFVPFTDLDDAERKTLSDAVNALRKPLATLTGVVFG